MPLMNTNMNADAIAADLLRLSPGYAATPLLDLPSLAAKLGIAQILLKDEGKRRLRSFKSLGGTYAGLRALARATGRTIADLLDPATRPSDLPALVCASDGNHGLAVASAARFAGAKSIVFLHADVPASRENRILAEGAEVIRVDGSYDDSVEAAARAAANGDAILIPDVTTDPDDPVVADVMAGYGVIAAEIRRQTEAVGHARPTHLFVQAGVGGLAAALAVELKGWLAPPADIVVVEPEDAPCVAAALAAGHIVRLPGQQHTSAEMLACGTASTPAFEILRRCNAHAVTVSEDALEDAPRLLRDHGGPATTPSGAAGLAGLVAVTKNLGPDSRAIIVVSEAALEE